MPVPGSSDCLLELWPEWTLLRPLLDLVWPRSCVGCGLAVGTSPFRYLCPCCSSRLPFIQPPSCVSCGEPMSGLVGPGARCPSCLEQAPWNCGGRSLMRFEGVAQSFVHRLKYGEGRWLGRDLGTLFGACGWVCGFAGGSLLVPVPLHPRKARQRGYNQARMIALAVAGEAAGAELGEVLVRRVDTSTQTRLSREERRRNMKNAFAIAPGAVLNRDRTHILVDDVFTTGSTLESCARCLRQGGVERVRVLTLCHG